MQAVNQKSNSDKIDNIILKTYIQTYLKWLKSKNSHIAQSIPQQSSYLIPRLL